MCKTNLTSNFYLFPIPTALFSSPSASYIHCSCVVIDRGEKTHLRKQQQITVTCHKCVIVQLIIMYIYHALTDILSAHMIRINLNRIFCTYTEQSPPNAIYIKPNKNHNECNPFIHTRHWSIHTCTHKEANNAVRKTTLARKHPTFKFETTSTERERERVNEQGYITRVHWERFKKKPNILNRRWCDCCFSLH